jgi:hypothetical protein
LFAGFTFFFLLCWHLSPLLHILFLQQQRTKGKCPALPPLLSLCNFLSSFMDASSYLSSLGWEERYKGRGAGRQLLSCARWSPVFRFHFSRVRMRLSWQGQEKDAFSFMTCGVTHHAPPSLDSLADDFTWFPAETSTAYYVCLFFLLLKVASFQFRNMLKLLCEDFVAYFFF